MNSIIQKWTDYIETKLMPLIRLENNDSLEGNMYSQHNQTKASNLLMQKQKNIVELFTASVLFPENLSVLEIGFNAGFSSLLIMMCNPEINLTAIDINNHKYTSLCYGQIKEDYPNINILYGSSTKLLPELHKQSKTYDIIHIDGGHTKDIAEQDIQNSINLCKPKSLIIVDDTNMAHIDKLVDDLLVKTKKAYDMKNKMSGKYTHRILKLY